MRPQIKLDASALEGALYDKLADGRWHINIKTGNPQPASKPNGRPISGFSPINVIGLYVRLNGTTHKHGLSCVRPNVKDDPTANGEKIRIGILPKYLIETVNGKSKYRIDDIVSECADLYVNGSPDAKPKSDAITLGDCFREYLGDRGAKLDDDGGIVPANGDPTQSKMITMREVLKHLDGYAADWRLKSVADLDAKDDIKPRAEMIRDGDFEKECPACRGSGVRDGDPCEYVMTTRGGSSSACDGSGEIKIGTYDTARTWLGAMATIHDAASIEHGGLPNGFRAVLRKFPKRDNAQRTYTEKEIATVINFDDERESGDDHRTGDRSSQKRLRMLAMKFQLLTGFRAEDVISLRKSDIKSDGGTYEIERHDKKEKVKIDRYIEHINSKASRLHYLPLPDRVAEIIDAAITVRDACQAMSGSEFIFCNNVGGKCHNGTKAFNVARDRLVELDLIKPEPVTNGKGIKVTGKDRLIVSHDCRRTVETFGEVGGISETTRRLLLDQAGIGAMTRIYNIKSHEQRMIALARLLPEYQKYCDLIFEIASRS